MPSRRDLIRMTDDEVQGFLETSTRWLQVATFDPDGWPQLTAMGYVMIDGLIHFTGYGASQKVQNLQRDSRITVMVEDGRAYEQLKGVVIKGHGEILSDDVDLTNRVLHMNHAKYFPEAENRPVWTPKRVIIRVRPHKVYSWDHVKLGGVH